jgi:hypothetical protein
VEGTEEVMFLDEKFNNNFGIINVFLKEQKYIEGKK